MIGRKYVDDLPRQDEHGTRLRLRHLKCRITVEPLRNQIPGQAGRGRHFISSLFFPFSILVANRKIAQRDLLRTFQSRVA